MQGAKTCLARTISRSRYDLMETRHYDREHDFHVMLRNVVPCRKLRWICRKHSNDVARQVETPWNSTIWSHDTTCRVEVTLYYDCKTHRYSNKDIFSLTTCELLRLFVSCCAAVVRYIIKHIFHKNLSSITFLNIKMTSQSLSNLTELLACGL